MIGRRPHIEARFGRNAERRRAARRRRAAPPAEGAATAQEGLVRAAEAGRFEALVDRAQPDEPVVMVTPEEREAELRAADKWSEDKPTPAPHAEPPAETAPPAPEPGMPTEPTPGMLWAEEHLTKPARGWGTPRPTHDPYRCLTEYDVLTGEIIGDGYMHYDEEEDG